MQTDRQTDRQTDGEKERGGEEEESCGKTVYLVCIYATMKCCHVIVSLATSTLSSTLVLGTYACH